jgi:hypothetical protein
MKAVRPTGKISDVFGFLKRKSGPSLSIEEINQVAKRGWGRQAIKITAHTNILARAITGGNASPRRSGLTVCAQGHISRALALDGVEC